MRELIQKIFDNLDLWRKLPSYQLEKRADIFFSLYLLEYLKEKKGYHITRIIPEFPIKKEANNQSVKVDYLVKTNKPSGVLFVELKTNINSKRDTQDDNMKKAQKKGIYKILEELRPIYGATNKKNKYRALFDELEKAELIKRLNGDEYEVIEKGQISIIYILPKPDGSYENVITFQELAEYIETKPDELSQRFAQSLREWGKCTF